MPAPLQNKVELACRNEQPMMVKGEYSREKIVANLWRVNACYPNMYSLVLEIYERVSTRRIPVPLPLPFVSEGIRLNFKGQRHPNAGV